MIRHCERPFIVIISRINLPRRCLPRQTHHCLQVHDLLYLDLMIIIELIFFSFSSSFICPCPGSSSSPRRRERRNWRIIVNHIIIYLIKIIILNEFHNAKIQHIAILESRESSSESHCLPHPAAQRHTYVQGFTFWLEPPGANFTNDSPCFNLG